MQRKHEGLAVSGSSMMVARKAMGHPYELKTPHWAENCHQRKSSLPFSKGGVYSKCTKTVAVQAGKSNEPSEEQNDVDQESHNDANHSAVDTIQPDKAEPHWHGAAID